VELPYATNSLKSWFNALPLHLPPQQLHRRQPRRHWLRLPELQVRGCFVIRGVKGCFVYNALRGHGHYCPEFRGRGPGEVCELDWHKAKGKT
jgi:hypothetical protein